MKSAQSWLYMKQVITVWSHSSYEYIQNKQLLFEVNTILIIYKVSFYCLKSWKVSYYYLSSWQSWIHIQVSFYCLKSKHSRIYTSTSKLLLSWQSWTDISKLPFLQDVLNCQNPCNVSEWGRMKTKVLVGRQPLFHIFKKKIHMALSQGQTNLMENDLR